MTIFSIIKKLNQKLKQPSSGCGGIDTVKCNEKYWNSLAIKLMK